MANVGFYLMGQKRHSSSIEGEDEEELSLGSPTQSVLCSMTSKRKHTQNDDRDSKREGKRDRDTTFEGVFTIWIWILTNQPAKSFGWSCVKIELEFRPGSSWFTLSDAVSWASGLGVIFILGITPLRRLTSPLLWWPPTPRTAEVTKSAWMCSNCGLFSSVYAEI